MTQETWISVKEAAALLGYSAAYFRRSFVARGNHRIVIREWAGPRGGRRVLVLHSSVLKLLEGQVKEPA